MSLKKKVVISQKKIRFRIEYQLLFSIKTILNEFISKKLFYKMLSVHINIKLKDSSKFFQVKLFSRKMILFSCFLVLIPIIVKAEMTSNSYIIESDVIGSFGNDSNSASYQLGDTGGETATEDMTSASYELRSGFWPTVMDYHISLSCDDSVNMGEISGTGQSGLSTNDATCLVRTDNPTGYSLSFNSDTSAMKNQDDDNIVAYTPASAGIPDQWSVVSSTSEWGARLKKAGTTIYDSSKWGVAAGTENYAASDVYWHNVTDDGSFSIVSENNETMALLDTEILQFGAEVGSNKIQPTGAYDVDVTVTAVSL